MKYIKGANYELKISNNQKSVLIVFPCFPCDIKNTKAEALFLKDIEKEGITTLLLDYNQKLFLTEPEKIDLAKTLNSILNNNKVVNENIYIGGFSSGGNMAIILSNFLLKTKNSISPKGVFAIDSPVDLEQLYKNALIDIKKNANSEAAEEGKFIVELLDDKIGRLNKYYEKYKLLSPYLFSCNATNNIEYLKDIKTRLYSEPALDWQLKIKNRKYEELNCYQVEKLHNSLLNLGSKKIEFIKTEKLGMRSNGERNPHSWSIVERESFIKWISN
jgi:hypothetical protein